MDMSWKGNLKCQLGIMGMCQLGDIFLVSTRYGILLFVWLSIFRRLERACVR